VAPNCRRLEAWPRRRSSFAGIAEVAPVPLVDYRCETCAAVQEIFAPSPVAETAVCQMCGGVARRQFGLGGLLGVRPARQAKDRLDRERATMAPAPAGAHPHHHDHHGHDHHHDHGHGHDRNATKEEHP